MAVGCVGRLSSARTASRSDCPSSWLRSRTSQNSSGVLTKGPETSWIGVAKLSAGLTVPWRREPRTGRYQLRTPTHRLRFAVQAARARAADHRQGLIDKG